MIILLMMTIFSIYRIHKAVLKNKINAKYIIIELSLLVISFIAMIVLFIFENNPSLNGGFNLTYTYVIIIYLLFASAFDKMELNMQKQKVENIVRDLAIKKVYLYE